MTNKLWQKSSAMKLHPLIEAYTVGEDPKLDLHLLPFDIQASKAHALGLVNIGILKPSEAKKLIAALTTMEKEFARGSISIRMEDEDCHTVIEHFLIKECGDLGKKIHTGRSRNDQVLVAIRLFLKDQLRSIRQSTLALAETFLRSAEKHRDVPFPGYSHTQQAMLSSLGHYFASFTENLLEDCEFLDAAIRHIDRNPLGTAAGFGVALPLDRDGTTKALGFSKLQLNSLACQTSRGKFESVALEAMVQVMLTLGRFAQDMLFFTSQECSFFTVSDELVTGSSIMPQKRNLDGLEILRGYISVVMGHQHAVQNIASRLLSGYNRDLQLLKKPLIESATIVGRSIKVVELYVQGLKPNQERIRSAITPGIFLADIATELAAKKGIPFRDAYVLASKKLPKNPDLQANIRSKTSPGAPGNLQLGSYRKRIAELKNMK